MFDFLISVLRAVVKGLWDAITATGATIWAIIISVLGVGLALLDTVNGWIVDMASAVSSAVLPTFSLAVPSEIVGILGLANRIIPLSEFMVFVIAWGLLCAVLMAYHIVKSWIPTLAAS